MKKYKITGLIVLMAALTVGFSSCLNDPNIEDQKYGLINLNANKIIELPADVSHTINLSELDEGVKEFTYEVRLAAEKPAEEDIVVNLEVISDRAALLKAVRTYQADKYPSTGDDAVPDADILSFPVAGIVLPASVTIPKGQRSVPLKVKIDTHQFTTDTQFGLIQIKGVNNAGYIVSGNFNQLLFSCKVRHKYAGRYVLTGTMEHLPNPSLYFHVTRNFATMYPGEDFTVQLQTWDGQSLVLYDELLYEDYIYPMSTATGLSGWGSFAPIFKFDANGNVIEVTNAYGQPAPSNTRSAKLDPSGVNKYDETTKSFTVSYWMVQPSAVAAAPHYRCHMVDTYTFLEDL